MLNIHIQFLTIMTRRYFVSHFLIFIFLLVSCVQAQKRDNEIRLFIIGNSFSQNASRYLPQLAEESNTELIIGRAELGGCSLQRHWEIVEAYEANPRDPKGRQYKGKSLKMLLSEGNWDYVTIQQNSMNSTDLDTYRPYARNLYEYIKSIQPDAEVLIHQTWAYRTDSKDFGRISKDEHTQSAAEMYHRSRAAYQAIADQLGIGILPVGDAFWAVSNHPKFAYKKDPDFNYEAPAEGALPDQHYSLHTGYYWKKDNTFGFDSHHANAAGEFLGSLVWYGVMFERSPENVKFTPENIPDDFARALKTTATKVVQAGAREPQKTLVR